MGRGPAVAMRVARYYGKGDIRTEEMPRPEPGKGEMLLRIHASGICGSDVMHWYRAGRGPQVLGHEIAGEVVQTGEGVTKYATGNRVSASHHVPCNTCRYCLAGHHTVCDTLRRTNFYPGGFSEYVLLPEINVERGVYLLPEELSYEEATFIEPLACVYRGQRTAGVRVGASVLVIGSGISGLLHIRLAKALGAGLVAAADIEPYRLDAARRSGADAVLESGNDLAEAFISANGGRPADIVILTTGAPQAVDAGMRSVDRGGTVLFFAPSMTDDPVPVPFNRLFWRNEITLTSSYAGDYSEHLTALSLIHRGKVPVHDLITHRLPLSETCRGFQLVESAHESLKVIITP